MVWSLRLQFDHMLLLGKHNHRRGMAGDQAKYLSSMNTGMEGSSGVVFPSGSNRTIDVLNFNQAAHSMCRYY